MKPLIVPLPLLLAACAAQVAAPPVPILPTATVAPEPILPAATVAPEPIAPPVARPAPPGASAAEMRSVAEANRAFGVALYRRLAPTSGNLFISPMSIAGAFGPVAAGARGETRAAVGKVLGFPSNEELLHRSLGSMLRDLESDGDGARVSIANALWPRHGLPVKPAFVAVARDSYDSEVENVDFTRPAEATARINRWVDVKTRNRIPELLDPGVLKPNTSLVITNAVHFLGEWVRPFGTVPGSFYLADGTTRRVRMLYDRRSERYAEPGPVQLLELPYKGGRLSMVAILPKKRGGLAAVEVQLSDARLGEWLRQLDSTQPQELHVTFPKVEMESSYDLVEPLARMGMEIAFGGRADFSGITDRELSITDVVHKTFLRIDEKGTEAAAATGVVFGESSGPDLSFQADQPFLVLIRDRQTGAVLFLGRIAEP